MNQFRSLLFKQIFLDTRNISGRLPLRFPPACHSSLLEPIRSLRLPPNSVFSAFPTCQRPLSACTIIYVIGAGDDPVCVNGIQTPSCWPLVPLRAA